MKLYHLSYDPVPFFIPRVPKSRLPMEDAETPRICLSDRIERCVNAKPCQAQALYLAKEHGLRMPLYVYEFDTDDIPPELLIGPADLAEESHEAAWLSWAVCELNRPGKDGKYATTDCVVSNCIEDIMDLLKSHA